MLDTAVALERMTRGQVLQVRALAAEGQGGAQQLLPEAGLPYGRELAFAALLCEKGGGAPQRLLPPYGALLRSWVTRSGRVAISSQGGVLALPLLVRENLKAIFSLAPGLPHNSRLVLARAVMASLLRNGIGVLEEGGRAAVLRAPRNARDVAGMPAAQGILAALNKESARSGKGESQSSVALGKALDAAPGSRAAGEFAGLAGLTLLLWLRHFEMHVYLAAEQLVASGVTCAVVGDMVHAASDAMLQLPGGDFMVGELGVLTRRPGRGSVGGGGGDAK